MNAFLHALVGIIVLAFIILAAWIMSVARDVAREEIRDRLEHIPHAILHLAACRLDREQRVTVYDDEWLPELVYILRRDEARPITRLFNGSWYAIGILFNARRIANRLDRPAPEQAGALPQDANLAFITDADLVDVAAAEPLRASRALAAPKARAAGERSGSGKVRGDPGTHAQGTHVRPVRSRHGRVRPGMGYAP